MRWLRFCFSTPSHTSATATLVIAIVTTVYAIVSLLQWGALRRANDINAANFYAIQRPFVSVTNIDGVPQQTGGNLTGVSFNIHPENNGSTPASNLVFYINYDDAKDPMPTDYGFADLNDVTRYPAIGAPRSVIRVSSHLYTIQELAALQRRDRFLYIYGRAEYNDRFKGTETHHTLFCFQLTSITGTDISTGPLKVTPGETTTFSFDWPSCPRHNCTDEECKEQGFIK